MDINEQHEAEIVAGLKKMQDFNVHSPIFNARKALREEMMDCGMPQEVASVVVGRMLVNVHPSHCSGAIYDQLLSATAKNITALWKAYSEEMSETTFLECSRTYMFCPPIIRRDAPPEDSEDEEKA